MRYPGRITLCVSLLCTGVAAQAGLERLSDIERPLLRARLATIPTDLGGWVGTDVPVDPKILDETQATDHVSRAYTNPKFPGASLSLWINYSVKGDNMRHSPEICLPMHGGSKIESLSQVFPIEAPGGKAVPVMRLGYSQGDLVQSVGFWYYIFGEGAMERWIRGLPITSRSSHGRTTRGSGMTVEVFWNGEAEASTAAFQDFAREVLAGLEPILPENRAEYHVP